MLSLASSLVDPMDQSYWLRRKRASVAKARNSVSAEARLIHFDLAGRYAVKAAGCAAAPIAAGAVHAEKDETDGQ